MKDFRVHDLRHTFASHFAMMGINIKTIQELLGHQTLRYAHLSNDHKRDILDAFASQMATFWTHGREGDFDRAGVLDYNSLTGKDLGKLAGVVEPRCVFRRR